MKKIVLTLFVSCVFTTIFSQGINFEHGTFAQALEKDKKENKLIFMDCYTTWCEPCKKMSKEVFTQKDVGDYLNDNFVNIKIDMEKGKGIELQKKYGVNSYPTMLFIDASGKVVHTQIGYCDTNVLIEQAKIAVDPSRQKDAIVKKYTSGERNPKFIIDYIMALNNERKYKEATQIAEDFLGSYNAEDILDTDIITILSISNSLKYGSEKYKFLLDNKDKFIKLDGAHEEAYDKLLRVTIFQYLSSLTVKLSLEEFQEAIEKAKNEYEMKSQQEAEVLLLSSFYGDNKEHLKLYNHSMKYGKKYLKKGNIRSGTGLVINVLMKVAIDSTFIKLDITERAITDAEEIIALTEGKVINPMFSWTLAVFYKRQGNKEKALENVNKNIEIMKSLGIEIDPKLLEFKEEIKSI
ncbi:thioredoxin fold domain-containing protein [Polaribacter sp. Q13]|uniref:thioredoxin family protein n=1 Tax=Polaribacter sp. Q13 TaxID=2806551 RepID=UPI00193C0344|nr:thioredoxin fold domain-containing protein [Polaribacter sp. Q13]QVY64998.1 DUF255 domain-containing protein [Polaribacter sp. Q13]